jgi:hypothetical protein
MKNFLIALTALAVSAGAAGQHTKSDSQTKSMTAKGMLDGKSYVVTLTDNSPGAGQPLMMDAERSQEHPVMTEPKGNDPGMDKKNNGAGTKMEDSKTGKRMVIRFEGGTLRTSGKGDLKVEQCAYNSWGMASTGISFSADCSPSASTPAKADPSSPAAVRHTEDEATAGAGTPSPAPGKATTQLTGTVNGDTIHGSMTCTRDDGTLRKYSYMGSSAGKNDLDLEGEMGMK